MFVEMDNAVALSQSQRKKNFWMDISDGRMKNMN